MSSSSAYCDRHDYNTQTQAAEQCALRIAAELSLAAHQRGRATLAVAFGADAQAALEILSAAELPWSCVSVTLLEELYTPLSDPRSREARLRACLLQNRAACARFTGLYVAARTTELAAFSASARLNSLCPPFDCALLTAEESGETAGFFKGSSRLKSLLDSKSRALALPNYVAARRETHLSAALPLIIGAGLVSLPLFGKEKLLMLEQALLPGAAEELPLRAVLAGAKLPAQIYWSP